MEIFKFGGASVKDADGVRNVAKVLHRVGYDHTLIVLSAMGKMTNAFESLVTAYMQKETTFNILRDEIETFHKSIVDSLFAKQHEVRRAVDVIFSELDDFLNTQNSEDYDFIYDQVVSRAELLSTKIVSAYLNEQGIENTWLDVRDLIKTNNVYRGAEVDWKLTNQAIVSHIDPNVLYITQGFIGRNEEGYTTTLGREGSDYSAGIFAYSLDATSLTIWKDVEGVLNADPRYFNDAQLLKQISYTEAIELAFYGASVIHPKTIQPLQKKEIPLYVKSFIEPTNQGTVVTRGSKIDPLLPCFIVKKDQLLVSISTLDFSFIMEQNISDIFNYFHAYKIKVNLIQNSAISFSVCIEDKYNQFNTLLPLLQKEFLVKVFSGATLLTIRHFTPDSLAFIEENNTVLLKQSTQETVQMVVQ
ncbi:aspartate kinase [Flavobacteriaceae bacterium F08102]|nr:aspartate kinase [Flavobacteriaceae bacterium F08102]